MLDVSRRRVQMRRGPAEMRTLHTTEYPLQGLWGTAAMERAESAETTSESEREQRVSVGKQRADYPDSYCE